MLTTNAYRMLAVTFHLSLFSITKFMRTPASDMCDTFRFRQASQEKALFFGWRFSRALDMLHEIVRGVHKTSSLFCQIFESLQGKILAAC